MSLHHSQVLRIPERLDLHFLQRLITGIFFHEDDKEPLGINFSMLLPEASGRDEQDQFLHDVFRGGMEELSGQMSAEI